MKMLMPIALMTAMAVSGAGCSGGKSGAAAGAPSISTQPANTSVLEGQTATFSVTATGDAPLAYQWKRNGSNVGADSPTFATGPVGTNDNGARFSVVVSNPAGQVESDEATLTVLPGGTVRIAYLHHSTGGYIWEGGVPEFFTAYNTAHGTNYQITEIAYPATTGGYPWANYPYDYWNLWVNHTGTSQDRGEMNLDQLAADYDVIMFKHCFPVSDIEPDTVVAPSVSSDIRTIANYQLQYEALKSRMKQFPGKKFILWTGAALVSGVTTTEYAQRAQTFFNWVKDTWDDPGDNIFLWDFYALETEGGLFMQDAFAVDPEHDSHPNAAFSATVAPYISQRIIDVVEGRGDAGSITGQW